jgi:hypothetical protein
VIKGQFEYLVGAKAVGFSHGDFSLVVQALYDPAGNQLLSPEVVKNWLPMLAKRAGDLLRGLVAGHGLAAPLVEKWDR